MNLTKRPIPGKPLRIIKALRESARGEACTLRLPGCDGGQTTVLCHIRRFGAAGAGHKPPDWMALYACHSCHEKQEWRCCDDADVMRAWMETLQRMTEKGLARWG